MKVSLSHMVVDNEPRDYVKRKKPDWLRVKMGGGAGFNETRKLVDEYQLNTVCESAKCPNIGECWDRGTATMMILGDVCTRSCGFCHIKTGRPPAYDIDEPRRVGEAAAIMNMKHLVITSVDRDELPDGGAAIWAETIRQIRLQSPGTKIEVLIPDFRGDWEALQLVLDERPDILNHNMESVRRMYKVVRPQAKYERSIELLRRGKAQGLTVKTGIMVGIGEQVDEVYELMKDLIDGIRVTGVNTSDPATNRPVALAEDYESVARLKSEDYLKNHQGPAPVLLDPEYMQRPAYPSSTYPGVHETCDILTIGQYLQPTRNHLPITRWVTPDEFKHFKAVGEALGFRHVESGPLVRSSYHADEQVLQMS